MRLTLFKSQIARAHDLAGLSESMSSITHGVVDGRDLLRSAVVQSVAALDHYCHGIILDYSVDILLGRRQTHSKNSKVSLPLATAAEVFGADSDAEAESIARARMADLLARQTFQSPEAIASGFGLVGITQIWSSAFDNPSGTREKLSLIVDRRNKIVHQGDTDPLSPDQLTPIDVDDAQYSVGQIELIVHTIDSSL